MIALAAAALMALGAAVQPSGTGAIEADPGTQPGSEIFRAIQLYYPDEYATLVDAIRRDPAAPAGKSALRARLLAGFYNRRSTGLRNAPADMLVRINERQLSLLRLIARNDVRLCAEFAASAFVGKLDVPAEYRAQAGELGALIIEASKQGESRPAEAQPGTLASDDAFHWYSQMLREEPSTEFAVARGEPGEEASIAELECRAGLATLAAISKLPREQGAKVSASFLAQAMSESAAD